MWRLLNTPSEEPEQQSAGVEFEQAREMPCQAGRIMDQSLSAVEKVLERVLGRVTDIGLRVDDERWLALGREHVASMEIGAQQHRAFFVSGKRSEGGGASASKTKIEIHLPRAELALELVSPGIAHRRQWPDQTGGPWLTAESREHFAAISASRSNSERLECGVAGEQRSIRRAVVESSISLVRSSRTMPRPFHSLNPSASCSYS